MYYVFRTTQNAAYLRDIQAVENLNFRTPREIRSAKASARWHLRVQGVHELEDLVLLQ